MFKRRGLDLEGSVPCRIGLGVGDAGQSGGRRRGLELANCFLIAPEFLDHGAMGVQGFDCAGCVFGGVELAIYVEDVFPGVAVDGARLDLGEVGSLFGQLRECCDEGSGAAFDAEREGQLVCCWVWEGFCCAAKEEEPGEVLWIVFDVCGEDLCAVVSGSCLAGDGGGVAVAKFDELLDASGGVVEGEGLHFGVVGEKSAALGEGYGVGKDAVDVLDGCARDTDEVVADAEEGFADDFEVVGEHEVEVLRDRAGKRVLNGDDCGIDIAACEGGEDFTGDGERDNAGIRRELDCCFVAE